MHKLSQVSHLHNGLVHFTHIPICSYPLVFVYVAFRCAKEVFVLLFCRGLSIIVSCRGTNHNVRIVTRCGIFWVNVTSS